MKSYYELIKSNLIDFNKVLLDNYSKINISETECLVLFHLNNLRKEKSIIDTDYLASKMSIDGNQISDVIVSLVNKGFVTIDLVEGVEEFSLDSAMKILGYLFENKEQGEITNALAIEMKKIIATLEQKLSKILTPNEIVVVKKWFYDYKYSPEMINEEIERVSKKKTAGVLMIDRGLFNRTKSNNIDEDTLKALENFKNKYGNN